MLLQPCLRPAARGKAPPSSSADSDSQSSSGSSTSPRCPRKHKPKSKVLSKSKRAHRKGGAHRDQDLSSTLSSSSDSDREEGELSGDEEQEEEAPPLDRLFPLELYPRVLNKATVAMGLGESSKDNTDQPPTSKKHNKLFPQGPQKPETVPFPTEFEHKAKIWSKLYSLSESTSPSLIVPTVDPPVVALSSAVVILSEGEEGPKDATDKRMEFFLKRSFEASAMALKAASANSIMARAAYVWANKVAASSKLPKRFRSQLKKISLAAAFASDSLYDALQLSARALATNAVARRHLWTWRWEGNSASLTQVVNIPFKGANFSVRI